MITGAGYRRPLDYTHHPLSVTMGGTGGAGVRPKTVCVPSHHYAMPNDIADRVAEVGPVATVTVQGFRVSGGRAPGVPRQHELDRIGVVEEGKVSGSS